MECDSDKTFTVNYLWEVRKRLSFHRNRYESFLLALSEFDENSGNIRELYSRICEALGEENSDLIDQFTVLLTPQQAECVNKLITYRIYKIWSTFLHKLNVASTNKPVFVQRVLHKMRELSKLPESEVTINKIKMEITPLLKGNESLAESLTQLFPGKIPPPTGTDIFDTISLEENDVFENITVPEDDGRVFGTNLCPCQCHGVVKGAIRKHCVRCSTRFSNQRIYVSTPKGTQRARVRFVRSGLPMSAHIKRLRVGNAETVEDLQPKAEVDADVEEVTSGNGPNADTSSDIWSKQEDKIILATCQLENDINKAFEKVHEILRQRSTVAISARFHTLLRILTEVSSKKN